MTKPVKRADLLRMVCLAFTSQNPIRPADVVPGTAQELSPVVGPMKTLIAEDSADNRLLLQAYLQSSPHQLVFAEDGKSALDRFRDGQFDLILMDIQMPVMDGLAATRAIRGIESQRGLARTPIVALTANALLPEIRKSQEAGCDAHVAKPISK